jgi:urea transport system ATP-binding protein
MLSIHDLRSGYGESLILRGVNLTVEPGQVVCMMGRNGVGKTTLMKSIMGLLKAKGGKVTLDGADIASWVPEKRARGGIGYVPQGREIFPQLTVEDNLLLGLEAATGRISKKRIPDSVFELFPVLRSMLQRKGGDLSGGQQQQLALARALIPGPKLLLLDEPMEGIQPSIVMEIEDVIRSIKKAGTMGVLLVEQSLEFAASIADHFYVMDKGTIVAEGEKAALSAEMLRKHLAV